MFENGRKGHTLESENLGNRKDHKGIIRIVTIVSQDL